MVIVKPLKLCMFYYIFMALFSVLISMPIFTFKVCWEIPCGEAFYLQKPSLELMTTEKKLHLMTHVWNYQVIICSVLITLRIIKESLYRVSLKPPTDRPHTTDHLLADQPTTEHRRTERRPNSSTTDQPPTDQSEICGPEKIYIYIEFIFDITYDFKHRVF